MIPIVIGNLRAITDFALASGLTRGTFVPVYVRNAHEALRGRRPADVEIVYVTGAELVLSQPGVRGYVGMLIAFGARERVHSA